MKVLLSIKPKFADLIFDGSKKFEFRKSLFKKHNIHTIVVYASYPIQKVIGEFTIEEILADDPETLWQKTKSHSGITEDYFDEYFANRNIAFAIKIATATKYSEPLCLNNDLRISCPPQSFMYIDE